MALTKRGDGGHGPPEGYFWHAGVRNPWLDLPASPPFVAPVDAPTLKRLDGRLTGAFSLRVDLRPQPWTGNLNTAELFLLELNPGFRDDDYTDVRDPDYSEQWRLALSFETRTPFYFLDPAFATTGGYAWWHRRLRDLIDVVGMEAVSRKVMCVEHFPYKSTSYKPLGAILPSQQYSFGVIRQANAVAAPSSCHSDPEHQAPSTKH